MADINTNELKGIPPVTREALDDALNTATAKVKIGLQTATPVNAVAATGTLTFTSTVSDGETVTIGTDVYEFDTDASVTSGNILVDVSGGATASAAVTALVAAITASDTVGVGGADGAGDTVTLTADTKGTAANSFATTETCANASFGAATLTGGVDGTVGKAFELVADASYLYVAVADNTVADTNWRRVTLGSAY